MQVWNMLHADRWKIQDAKIRHLCTIIVGRQSEKTCETTVSPPHVLTIWWTSAISGWDPLASLGHPCKFQRVSHLGSVTARQSSSGRQPNFAALNRGNHLYSAGQLSRWGLAHISSVVYMGKYNMCYLSCKFKLTKYYVCINASLAGPEVTYQLKLYAGFAMKWT